MKKLSKKSLALLLVIMSFVGVIAGIFPAVAADGYQEGDVIYVDFSAMPQWTGETQTGVGVAQALLYVNFTANTRYDSGEKETVNIGDDPSRFDPKLVTEKVKDYVYKYVVTSEDAGAQTLRFWRGSDTLLWNHSVELTYADYASGNNAVYITDYNSLAEGSGSIGHEEYLDYELEGEFSITALPDSDPVVYGVSLSYKKAIDADVTYSYEIYVNDELVTETQTCEVTPESMYTPLKGIITAKYSNGTVAARATVYDSIVKGGIVFSAAEENNLYAHAVSDGGVDQDAWISADKVGSDYYFFLPSSVSDTQVEIYSTYGSAVSIGGVTIHPGEIKTIEYDLNTTYRLSGGASYNLKFRHSGAEAALFVNNDGSIDGSLWNYLTADKSNEASAYAAVVDADGTIENTDIKKIKGRGNTTWAADKKPFNVNFKSAVTVGSMQSTKKYSLLANFQDAALSRNRVLYDLGDAVGLPYSCDSRFVDFYMDGEYIGQYQMCQKIDPGSDNLVYDMDEDDYINDDGSLKEDFSMLIEVPFAEDFYTSTNSGIDVVIKSPDVEGNDNLYANEVKAYAREKFDRMYTALKNNSADMGDYLDIDSFAKAYLIQEVGKNWDTHSWYLCYMPDENGTYKFFASPVWDFDNSIGNANGVRSDLNSMGVTDYTKYTGWWCKYKQGSNNMTYMCTQNETIMDAARTIWFKKFVPAIEVFAGTGSAKTEILSQDLYYDALAESADMNYMIWDLLTDTSWVADHSSITKATFDYDTLTYKVDSSATRYDQYTFKGQFDYMTDWLTSRAAWMSNEWKADYVAGDPVPEVPEDKPPFDPSVQPTLPDNTISAWVFNSTGKTIGEKLTEYGDKSGYAATTGDGTFVGSVNSDGYRALEWSAAEYGTGAEVVPIMPAGSKNPWGSDPYVQVTLSTKGYENIAISLTSAGSKKCPASWQLAYSTDGETFTDIEGASYTIALDDRKTPIAYFDGLALPGAVADKDTVTLRLYAVSDTTVSGGTTADDPTGGEFVINNIIITGDVKTTTSEPTVTTTAETTTTEYVEPSSTQASTSGGDIYIVGDADGNELVNVKDATIIQKHVAALEVKGFNALAADANRDSNLNVKDATEIQRFIAGLPAHSMIGEKVSEWI
ncbi:MAG: CotH kinase family protein [Clostridia bacterium]|nr:CotH kinase family protein [Clostridia bacterium]